MSPCGERDTAMSVSSDSVSLPTQLEVLKPESSVATELVPKLTMVHLEKPPTDKTQEDQSPALNIPPPDQARPEAKAQPEKTVDRATTRASASGTAPRPETTKEEGPQDLRVFELNSDSGKSTPSNNGKKGKQGAPTFT